MTKLWARLYLWRRGWCVKHRLPKDNLHENTLTRFECDKCKRIRLLKDELKKMRQEATRMVQEQRIQRAVETLGGKQG